jgi:hypothetical protein
MRNRICSLEYINTQLDLSNLRDVEKPIEDNDMLQYDLATATWQTKKVLDNITLASPWGMFGDGSWDSVGIWDISNGAKTIVIGTSGTNYLLFEDSDGNDFIRLSAFGNTIAFGNSTDNTNFFFAGSGEVNIEGFLEVDNIGPADGTDPSMIELSTELVAINANFENAFEGDPCLFTKTTISDGLINNILDVRRDVGATSQTGDGVCLRLRLIDDVNGTKNTGRFCSIKESGVNDHSIVLESVNNGILGVVMKGDSNQNAMFPSNVRIGDTTAPTEALEANGNIVQSEANGSRYLLRYSLMGA